MIINDKNEACPAWVHADYVFTTKGDQLFFIHDCSGVYTKEDDYKYKKYPKSKKVHFQNGTECRKTFEDLDEWREWESFLHDEIQAVL